MDEVIASLEPGIRDATVVTTAASNPRLATERDLASATHARFTNFSDLVRRCHLLDHILSNISKQFLRGELHQRGTGAEEKAYR